MIVRGAAVSLFRTERLFKDDGSESFFQTLQKLLNPIHAVQFLHVEVDVKAIASNIAHYPISVVIGNLYY